jgi:hypothetical protein
MSISALKSHAIVAYSALTACVALTAGAVVLTLLARGADAPADVRIGVVDALAQIALLAFPVVGVIIARQRPDNTIAWLFCGLGLAWSLYVCADAAAVYSLYATQRAWPAARWIAWVANGKGGVIVYVTATLTPLFFPNGQLLSRRWRTIVWLLAGALIVQLLIYALDPGDLVDYPGVRNPLNQHGLSALSAFDLLSTLAALTALVGGCAAAVVRFRRAKGIERRQLEWFAWAAALIVAMFVLAGVLDAFNVPSALGGLLVVGAILALPLATGVAILRYQLFDIDRLVNRTLVYGLVTAALGALYVLAVVVLQPVMAPLTNGSDLVVAGTTLLVAALFRPLRERTQRLVDLRFYRDRYDAERVINVFSARLREEIELDAVSDELLAVVHATLQPEHVSLWLAPAPESRSSR